MSKMLTIDTSTPTAIKVDAGKVLNLVPEDDLSLKTPTSEFSFETADDLEKAKILSRDLIETVKKYNAFGLAANQCGIPYSAIAIGYKEDYYTLFNPKIISTSEEDVMMQEGCLSFPFLILGINRPKSVVVEFQDPEGTVHTQTLEGLSARVVLHEIDHLNGVTFNTVAKPMALKSGFKKREKQMQKYARHIATQRRFANG